MELTGAGTGVPWGDAGVGVGGTQVTGLTEGAELETMERYLECGEVTCTVRLEETHGHGYEIEITLYGWDVCLSINAISTMPWAVQVGAEAGT